MFPKIHAFSRGGDGKAAPAPVLREYVIGQAMHARHVPTSRALAAVASGEQVIRDEVVPGAVLARVASSHIRVGTFQYFANRGEVDKVKQLANYAIAQHYPKLQTADNPYLEFLGAVTEKQAQLIAKCRSMFLSIDQLTIHQENRSSTVAT
jgi:uncharacterized protein YdiU (UPF0061 family)